MKIFTFLIAGILPLISVAQDQKQVSKERYYYVAEPHTAFIVYNETESDAQKKLGPTKIAISELKFDVYQKSAVTINNVDYYIVDFYEIKKEERKSFLGGKKKITKKQVGDHTLEGSTTYINSSDNLKLFAIKAVDFKKYIDEEGIQLNYRLFSASNFIYGASFTTPFKFRPAIKDKNYVFNPEIQLGGYFGYKFRLSHTEPYFLNFPVISAGFNSIQLNDNTQTSTTTSQDGLAMGFTSSVGLIFQINDYQLGIMVGSDLLGGDLGKNWIYNEQPWFSIGIGFSFLGGSKGETNKDQKSQNTAIKEKNQLVNNLNNSVTNKADTTHEATINHAPDIPQTENIK